MDQQLLDMLTNISERLGRLEEKNTSRAVARPVHPVYGERYRAEGTQHTPYTDDHSSKTKKGCCGPGSVCAKEANMPPCIDMNGVEHNLYVVVPISNYVGFERRYELFRKCLTQFSRLPNVVPCIVEVVLGDRPPLFDKMEGFNYLCLQTNDEVWHKENMINIGIARLLPKNWKYVAWWDGDIEFDNHNIGSDTINQLQSYPFVQCFESATDLGPDGEALRIRYSWYSRWAKGDVFPPKKGYNSYYGQPGFAAACTRDAFNAIGRLPDFCIVGAGDYHLARALIGEAEGSIPKGAHPIYAKKVMDLQERCEKHIRRKIGYVKGNIRHGWHGRFEDRRYNGRWEFITDVAHPERAFDPDTDIKYDWQGLIMWNTEKSHMIRGVQLYFRQRNENSIDLQPPSL